MLITVQNLKDCGVTGVPISVHFPFIKRAAEFCTTSHQPRVSLVAQSSNSMVPLSLSCRKLAAAAGFVWLEGDHSILQTSGGVIEIEGWKRISYIMKLEKHWTLVRATPYRNRTSNDFPCLCPTWEYRYGSLNVNKHCKAILKVEKIQ